MNGSSVRKKDEQMKTKESPSQAVVPSQGSKRKQYDLPGQIHDPPEESEPLRIFYETLYNQRPDSEMAQIWMMENGLLEEEEAIRVQAIKAKRNRGIPATNSSSQRTPPAAASTVSRNSSASKSGGKAGKAPADLVPLGKASSAKKPDKGAAKKPDKGAAKKPEKVIAKKKKKAASSDEDDDGDSEDDVPLTKIKRR